MVSMLRQFHAFHNYTCTLHTLPAHSGLLRSHPDLRAPSEPATITSLCQELGVLAKALANPVHKALAVLPGAALHAPLVEPLGPSLDAMRDHDRSDGVG